MVTNMNDVYYRVGYRLAMEDFDLKNVEDKKILVDNELKKYVIEKLSELGSTNNSNYEETNLTDLVEELGQKIPKEHHFDTLRHMTHFVLNIAGEMQGFSITWWSTKDEVCRNLPVAHFNDKGFWDDMNTHKDDSYVRTFGFVYDVFVNRFMKKVKVNQKILNN